MHADSAPAGTPAPPGGSELRTIGLALYRQWLVLSAMILREARVRHGRSFSFAFTLGMLEPLIIIGAICLLFYLINRPPIYGNNMVLFVATGVFPVYLFIQTTSRMHEPLLTAHVGRYPIEVPLDGVLAHATLHALASATVAVLFFAAFYACGEKDALPYDLGQALTALLAIYGFGVGAGIANAVVGRVVPLWGSIWPAISRASVHFSGIYYIVAFFPPGIRDEFAVNPMLHGVEWFRTAFFPFYPAIELDRGYLVWGMAVSVLLGLCLERVFRRRLVRGD
jgi:capsular polysaccharide transport system permease protein